MRGGLALGIDQPIRRLDVTGQNVRVAGEFERLGYLPADVRRTLNALAGHFRIGPRRRRTASAVRPLLSGVIA